MSFLLRLILGFFLLTATLAALVPQVIAREERSGKEFSASLVAARQAETGDSDVELIYMDDLVPAMWFPRGSQQAPEWLNADSSERRPMSWALWYSAVARYVAGHKDIMLVVLSKEGQNAATRKALTDAGANIQFDLSEIGYFRALVPLASMSRIRNDPYVEEVESAPYSTSGILFESLYRPITDQKAYEAVSARYLLKRFSPAGEPAPLQCCATQVIFNPAYIAERQASRANDFIADNRPDVDLGLDELRKTHPTFDGRGVTVGVYDYLPQLDHPALGEALNLDGHRISKIPRVQLDPSTFSQSLALFTFHEPSHDERLRFGSLLSSLDSRNLFVAEARIDREYADTIKAVFDPNSRRFGFDIDKDGRIGPTEWFRDYRTAPSESVLYTTRFPTGAERSAVFYLFADLDNLSEPKAAFILEWMHGTVSSSVVGASGGASLRALGLAPGSQVVPHGMLGTQDPQYDPVSSTLDLLLSAILAKDIDVVTAQAGFSLSEINSYEFTQKAIERALAVRPKAVFISSGNSTSSIDGHFGNSGVFARGVTAIGASVGPHIGSALFGQQFGGQTVDDPVTSNGPSADGARSTLLYSTSRYPSYASCVPGDIRQRILRPEFADRMPYCTWQAFATSGASPPAAAVAASLFSGLRQRGYTGDSTVVAEAMTASAEPIDHGSYDFVAGQISATRAWSWLEKNVLSKPAGSSTNRSKLSDPFDVRAPIRHEESLRTDSFYSTRGLYDRYFGPKDVGKCTSIWVRSLSGGEPTEHELTMTPSGGPVVLVTTKLTGTSVWQPITLCVAASIESVWSGIVSIHGVASATSAEQRIPVTIVAPMKLRPGENHFPKSAVRFREMLVETIASLPLALGGDDEMLTHVSVEPLSAKSKEPILDWVTVNGAPQNPPLSTTVRDEAGLLVRARLLAMPPYPTENFSLSEQRKVLRELGQSQSWSVSVDRVPLRDHTQLRVSSAGQCSASDQVPTVLFRTGAKSDMAELEITCLPEIGALLLSFSATDRIDSLLILKPESLHRYEFAVFRYHNGIWLPQVSSLHSIWKPHEELKDLSPGEWRIFVRRVGSDKVTEQGAGKVEPKQTNPQ